MKVPWLLLALCGAAQAQDGWIELARNDKAVAYTQGSPSRAPSGKPAVWVYLDYTTPGANGAMSARTFFEADCTSTQTRMLAVSYHSSPRGGGAVVGAGHPSDWSPAPPGTMRGRFWEYACTGK